MCLLVLLLGLIQQGTCLSLSLPPPRVGDLLFLDSPRHALAHVSAVKQSTLTCHFLCTRPSDDPEANGDVKFYFDEECDAVLLEASPALALLDPAAVLLSQRQIPDRRSNPHSEESEDVFFVRGDALIGRLK